MTTVLVMSVLISSFDGVPLEDLSFFRAFLQGVRCIWIELIGFIVPFGHEPFVGINWASPIFFYFRGCMVVSMSGSLASEGCANAVLTCSSMDWILDGNNGEY